jgi:hypothetical protein
MATSMPDFKAMLSTRNSSLKDIYDQDFLRTSFKENVDLSLDSVFGPEAMPLKSVSSPSITKEIELMLKTMSEHLNIPRQELSSTNNLLAEDFQDYKKRT